MTHHDARQSERIGELAATVVGIAARMAEMHIENRSRLLELHTENRRTLDEGFGRLDRRVDEVHKRLLEFRQDVDTRLGRLEHWRTALASVGAAIMFFLANLATGALEALHRLLSGGGNKP